MSCTHPRIGSPGAAGPCSLYRAPKSRSTDHPNMANFVATTLEDSRSHLLENDYVHLFKFFSISSNRQNRLQKLECDGETVQAHPNPKLGRRQHKRTLQACQPSF